ncbi:MAG: hypothetical protein RBT68_02005 [Spirochaetia bacterium]|nr:hypothetical protein [Spirochaetia bacterium]
MDLTERFKRFSKFWAREDTDRPSFGFGIPFPAKSLQAGLPYLKDGVRLFPGDFNVEEFRESYELLYHQWEAVDQDAFWTAVPWNGVPWFEAMAGCGIASNSSGFDALPINLPLTDPGILGFAPETRWTEKYRNFLDLLGDLSGGRFPVGQPILRGIMDTLGAMAGNENFIYTLYDNPDEIAARADEVAKLLIGVLKDTVNRIAPYHGGTCLGFYNLWAPGPAAWFQDDLAVLFSPEQYRELCGGLLQELSSSFPYTMFHLHPAAFQHLDTLLEIKELSAIQVNRDLAGPSVGEMLPALKKIQEHKSLVVQGILDEDDINHLARSLEPRGLHFTCMVPDFAGAEKLRVFLARSFGW